MTDRFENLTAACGGTLSIESLTRFQLAMREYEVFMREMRQMLAPVPDAPPDAPVISMTFTDPL